MVVRRYAQRRELPLPDFSDEYGTKRSVKNHSHDDVNLRNESRNESTKLNRHLRKCRSMKSFFDGAFSAFSGQFGFQLFAEGRGCTVVF